MKSLARYFLVRLGLTLPMIFILLSVVFLILRVMPGDPVSVMLGGHTSREFIEEQRKALGLDRPIIVQYFDYLWHVLRLDLGRSVTFNQKVIVSIKERLPATLELIGCGLIITLLVGIPLGAYAADKRRKPVDYLIRLWGIVIFCVPFYWLGLLFQLFFGVWLGWLPIAGRVGARTFTFDFERTGFYILDTIMAGEWSSLGDVLLHLALPAATMGLVLSGVFIRITRANMLDVLSSDHILAARARGIPHHRLVYHYALKNAFAPILTMLGLQFAMLIAGAVLCETTFSWPGLGRLLLESIYLRDYPAIQGVVVVYALMVALISLTVDLLYGLLDPRVRY